MSSCCCWLWLLLCCCVTEALECDLTLAVIIAYSIIFAHGCFKYLSVTLHVARTEWLTKTKKGDLPWFTVPGHGLAPGGEVMVAGA